MTEHFIYNEVIKSKDLNGINHYKFEASIIRDYCLFFRCFNLFYKLFIYFNETNVGLTADLSRSLYNVLLKLQKYYSGKNILFKDFKIVT